MIAIAFFLLCMNTARAVSVKFNSPVFVRVGENFTVHVMLNDVEDGSYDIKTEVLGTNGERIGRVFSEGKWRSTFYYVKNAIKVPERNDTSIKLKVENYIGMQF